MHYAQFVQRFKELTGIVDPDDALRIIGVIIETLGERLSRTHRKHLMHQLPDEMKEYLPKHLRKEHFRLEEYYNRVSARANISYRNAVAYSRAAMQVLKEAVAAGELQDILAEIPDEYKELFSLKKPQSPLPASAI